MFVYKSLEDLASMSVEEQSTYMVEKANHETAIRKKEIEDAIAEAQKNNVSKEDMEKLTKKNEAIVKEIEKLTLDAKKRLEGNGKPEPTGLAKYIAENSEVLKGIKENGANSKMVDFTVNKTQIMQVAADIVGRDAYAQTDNVTQRKPVRRTSIMDLFKRKPVSSEFYKYREENAVTRDAKMVVACAPSNHTTKKTWIVRTVELAKVRDIVDACIDMLDDYAWVESELKELITESIKLKAEYEILLGASANPTDMLSINSISSTFNAANPLAPFALAFQDANLEQLADAMAAQIAVFGQENSWQADTIVMNFTDFIKFRNLKDANGNRLILTLSDTNATIAGLNVVTSPIVVANTAYVFDSRQGEILDRQSITVKTSFENNDNIEHEVVTFVAVERLQFHVPTIKRNAFMKVTDIAAAITAITAP